MKAFDYSTFFTNEKQQVKTFSVDRQKWNNISNTTIQKVKHDIFKNIRVSISGSDLGFNVWLKVGKNITMKFEKLTLIQAVNEANKLIKNV